MTAGPHRLDHGGRRLDRGRPIEFSFDARKFTGFDGDTVASALLANGVRIVGRSFKYHRPRGIWCAGVEEPNAVFDVTSETRRVPNCRGTTTALRPGMSVASVNASPSADADRLAALDRLSPFLSAGFYYKTFMWPRFARYEAAIRRMAGLGRLDPRSPMVARASEHHDSCDVLIIGAGPAGLACATAAAKSGAKVIVADTNPQPGGSLLYREAEVDGECGRAWVARIAGELPGTDRVRLLAETTAFGIYDHGLVALVERRASGECLRLVRPKRTVIATGAIERPMLFVNNDRPGVMSANAALAYLEDYAVIAGRNIVVATNNDSGYEPAWKSAQAGAHVVVLDSRDEAAAPREPQLEVRHGRSVEEVLGNRGVEGVSIRGGSGGERLEADALLVAGGFVPTIHLYCQAGGVPRWNDARGFHEPATMPPGIAVAGAANGSLDLASALAEGHAAGGGQGQPPRSTGRNVSHLARAMQPPTAPGKRVWVDMQSDVTTADIDQAAKEGFSSVEHLKRYTTLGMATDQGKTGNLNGLAVLGAATDRGISDLGVTTYRPPFTPVSFGTMAGRRGGELMQPLRRLPTEAVHRGMGAVLSEYGGWLRPAHYPPGTEEGDPIAAEARATRESATLFDASSLGKIEVLGPQAAALLDFVCYHRVSQLDIGQMRYGYMLRETGTILDDGIVARLDENRFVVSCSSAHATAIGDALEEWRQSAFDPMRVHVHEMTAAWGTVTVAGPQALELLARLAMEVPFAGLPHMWTAQGMWNGRPCRIARASFTGERSYEITVPACAAADLWRALAEAGGDLGLRALGIEGLSILRAEKGYPIVGRDTDATTMPQDLGAGGPRLKRKDDFVGKRSLFTEDGNRSDRRQLVGVEASSGGPALPVGAHAVERHRGRLRSIGFVTTSHASPTLGRPIALALLESGASRHGETIMLRHLGTEHRGIVTHPCAYDRQGARLND